MDKDHYETNFYRNQQNKWLNKHAARLTFHGAVLNAIRRLPIQFTLNDVMEYLTYKKLGYYPRWKVCKYLDKIVDRHLWLTTLVNCRGDGDSFYLTYELVWSPDTVYFKE